MSPATGHQQQGAERNTEEQADEGSHQANQVHADEQAKQSENLQSIVLNQPSTVLHRRKWAMAVMDQKWKGQGLTQRPEDQYQSSRKQNHCGDHSALPGNQCSDDPDHVQASDQDDPFQQHQGCGLSKDPPKSLPLLHRFVLCCGLA